MRERERGGGGEREGERGGGERERERGVLGEAGACTIVFPRTRIIEGQDRHKVSGLILNNGAHARKR